MTTKLIVTNTTLAVQFCNKSLVEAHSKLRVESVVRIVNVGLYFIFLFLFLSLNLNTSILSFVDDVLLISQRKIYNTTLPKFYSSYRVVTDLMVYFGLVMEHNKSEIFYFSRMHNDLNLELDLLAIGTPIFKSKIY